MAFFKLKSALTLFFIVTAFSAMAQDCMMKTLRRLIKDYPSAYHRMEHRYEPADSNTSTRELRFDFRIRRDALAQSDYTELMRLYAKAWDSADSKTDRMQQYAHGDSICSTIVYGLDKNKDSGLLQDRNPSRFWGNPGYLLFDAGMEISIVADKLECVSQSPRKANFDDIIAVAEKLCRNHKVIKTAVKYTGNVGHFVFQRGTGKGWTRGDRYAIKDCTKADFNLLKNAFMAHFETNEAINIMAYNNKIMLKSEKGPEVFLASFHNDNTVYFLSATVEDEICIPHDWEHINCYNNERVEYVDVSRLDSLYEDLSKRCSMAPVTVQYTGGMSPQISGFAWQRGWGSGWTRGYRLELTDITPAEKANIFSVFSSYTGLLEQVNIRPDYAGTYEEGTRTFYGFQQTENGKAYFIRATTEGEICIPSDWTTRNYYKGSTNPAAKSIAAFGNTQKYIQYLYGLSKLWAGAKQNFVFMDRVSVNWDSIYIAMMPRMMEVKDDRQAIRLLQEMCARLQDGHTYVYGIKTNPWTAPVSTKRIGGQVYIDAVRSSHLLEQGIRRGQELVGINGMSVDKYVDRYVKPYACSSTPQWTEHICYEGYELMKWEPGEKVVWTLKDGDRLFDYNYISGNEEWDISAKSEPLLFSVLDNKIGYLKISSFANSDVTELFDSIYPKLLATHALIIDIRGNSGGNSGFSEYIVSHFATDTIRTSSWKTPMYMPAYASWGYGKKWHHAKSENVAPVYGKQIYTHPVVLLVDNGTFSAAEDFCSMFLSIKRGKLIGRTTGGSTGNGVRIELIPGLAMANICSKHDTAADGTEFVGHGFKPDIQVEETYQSYFHDEHDAAITTACDVLKEQMKKEEK